MSKWTFDSADAIDRALGALNVKELVFSRYKGGLERAVSNSTLETFRQAVLDVRPFGCAELKKVSCKQLQSIRSVMFIQVARSTEHGKVLEIFF